MNGINHEKQKEFWDREHQTPNVLKQMDQDSPSSGVVKFYDFLKEQGFENFTALEMGCGKGRNVIWLAKQDGLNPKKIYGFDFSPSAINEAKRRSKDISNVEFFVHDAIETLSFAEGSIDCAIDCFASTDIESADNRRAAINEIFRVLKFGGYLLVYLLSTDDEFHQQMIREYPAHEKNAFYHSTGKFEKVFEEKEIIELYRDFDFIKWERLEKVTIFHGKEYRCKHHWLILKK